MYRGPYCHCSMRKISGLTLSVLTRQGPPHFLATHGVRISQRRPQVRAGSTSRDRGPTKVWQGASIHASPLGSSSVALSRVSTKSYQQPQAQAHAHEEKQSGLPDAELETRAEHIHTCLNRTSHLERSHLLRAVVSRSFGWHTLGSPTSCRPPCRASQVRPRSSRSTAGSRSCS